MASELETFTGVSGQISTFETDELTALCPFDFGGPDFYELVIRYESSGKAVESRSLKKMLQSYRNTGISAECLADEIYRSIENAVQPKRCYIRLDQQRRGGVEQTVERGDDELRR